ncbi:LemA family protein [Streptococcus agalactiae]
MGTMILIAIIALFVIWLIVAYNSLVRSRMHTKESWSQIDVQLKRRNDLISNLIETVKGYAAYEGKTLEKIAELRAQVAKANTPTEAMTASNELTRQLSSILAVAENYPDLKANNSFVKLQEELTNTENKISYSRQLYNTTTSNYNVKLETFPSNIVGKLFGFKPSQFLETPEEEKEVPKVSFDF